MTLSGKSEKVKAFTDFLEGGIRLLDGALGTMIQKQGLKEKDFRGRKFLKHDMPLAGCNDLLNLTRPDVIIGIHKKYAYAGADIISTNTFNSNAVSLKDYGLDSDPMLIEEINREGAVLARQSVAEISDRKIFIAGSVGPTNRSASLSPDINKPEKRNITFDELYEAYKVQITGLIKGDADILLFETFFDTLNLKAALMAADDVMTELSQILPVMVSATLVGKTGRTLSGQTLEALLISLDNYDSIVSVGINCIFDELKDKKYLEEIEKYSDKFISFHPNAGLPDELGQYKLLSEDFASHIEAILKGSLVNVVGGCCGTTPEFIAGLRSLIDKETLKPHKPENKDFGLRLSGLEALVINNQERIINVGERCNVAGSRKFLRLIKEGKLEEASTVALAQIDAGAKIVDINMDDAMLDAVKEMKEFIRYVSADPGVAKVPFMIDSSDWRVIESGLKNCQGKSIVNSLSLKEGEEKFIDKAIRIKKLGAALIVMAFDEKGQADSYERKIEICRRAYDILVKECGYKPSDIIFDVNVMAIGTGDDKDLTYALDFIRAVSWIKENLPESLTSGGISNLSFAFRGKNHIREAMHSVFLHHALSKGLDMAIVNPSSLIKVEDIPEDLKNVLENLIFNQGEKALERLIEYASEDSTSAIENRKEKINRREEKASPDNEVISGLISADAGKVLNGIKNLLEGGEEARKIIEGPMMKGMDIIGERFGSGTMFLPQVVKSARVMQEGVNFLTPYLQKSNEEKAATKEGKVLFATVKGDVHDIGKNIVATVLSCNNYEIIDMGVMVPAEKIVETAKKENPDIICLSGLITPSLSEMVNVARKLEEENITIPIIVGGATTSLLHTAVKIAPEYSGIVAHSKDAARNSVIASKLVDKEKKNEFIRSLREDYDSIRKSYYSEKKDLIGLEEARQSKNKDLIVGYNPIIPKIGLEKNVIINIKLNDILPFLNWKMLYHSWGLHSKKYQKKEQEISEKEKKELVEDVNKILNDLEISGNFYGKGIIKFIKVNSKGDNILYNDILLPFLRQQEKDSEYLSVSDFILNEEEGEDYIGLFAVTSGNYLLEEGKKLIKEGDYYKGILYQILSDRLAEAASEWLHEEVRSNLWGYQKEHLCQNDIMEGRFEGIRPAWGYPMMPDQLMNLETSKILPLNEIGVEITENGAMIPSSSVSGIYIANPKSRYFLIGSIDKHQAKDYAERRNLPIERIREILNK